MSVSTNARVSTADLNVTDVRYWWRWWPTKPATNRPWRVSGDGSPGPMSSAMGVDDRQDGVDEVVDGQVGQGLAHGGPGECAAQFGAEGVGGGEPHGGDDVGGGADLG